MKVTKKFGRFLPVLYLGLCLGDTLAPLFSKTDPMRRRGISLEGEGTLFGQDEVVAAAKHVSVRKSPGIDCTAWHYCHAVQVLAQIAPEKLVTAFNYCLMSEYVPKAWKVARLAMRKDETGRAKYLATVRCVF